LAQVVTVSQRAGSLLPDAFAGYDLRRAPRLLVRSACSDMDPRVFPAAFVHPSPELAAFLGEQGVILYGTDAPSMDAENSKTLAGHHALAEARRGYPRRAGFEPRGRWSLRAGSVTPEDCRGRRQPGARSAALRSPSP
jgi:hypothetical protein